MVVAGPVPPPIPASRMEPGWGGGRHLLVWVHTGAVTVEPEPGRTVRIEQDHGIWLPADHDRRRVGVDAGSLAFPLLVPPDEVGDAPTTDTVFGVPGGWRDWLIQQYVFQVAPVIVLGRRAADLLSMLRRDDRGPAPSTGEETARPTPPTPPVPSTPAAEQVARELARDPAIGWTVEQWAARVCSSPRTLRRAFAAETGRTFAEWRTMTRVIAAAEFLAAGYAVERAAARCGFGSRSGFGRAFRSVHGMSPGEFRRAVRDAGEPSPAGGLHPLDGLARSRGRAARSMQPPRAAVTWTAPRVNDFHVLIWVYRGIAHARIDGVHHDLAQGDAIWLPAGMPNETGSPADSTALPVGDLPGREVRFDTPLRVRFPSTWDTFLLHSSVACYTGLRPDGHDRRRLLEVFADHMAAEQSRALPMPTDPAARSAALRILRALAAPTTGHRTDRAGSPLDATFLRETGLTVRGFAHTARMRAAADLLDRGLSPSSVAHRVGYAHLANFSRAFRRFHGVAPSALGAGVATARGPVSRS